VERIVKNVEISRKLDELLLLIEQDVAIQEYKEIENNLELLDLIKKTKKYQQTADNSYDELNKHPLIMEYKEKLKHADDLLQHITYLLESEIHKNLLMISKR
jgi:cell fate (sporulation/competence/biofilm development) regulator YmcA (YheA/YmcA/DUF963 family)